MVNLSILLGMCFAGSRPAIGFNLPSNANHELRARISDSLDSSKVSRREWLSQSAFMSAAFFGTPARADDSSSKLQTVPKNKSIIVLGANGGTGRECVLAALASGRTCYATARSGSFTYEEENESSILSKSNSKLFEDQADVTNVEGLLALVDKLNSNNSESVGAMIFAASASAKENNAVDVDYQGVINVAHVCIEKNIPRLVVVSSGAVTRPNSAVYKLLNFVGNGIMEAKINGEDKVRELYASKEVVEKGLGYTIVRPGGLTNDKALGPSYLEVNQGDDKSGRLSRADVAGTCIGCLDIPTTFDTTFECYLKDTAKPVDNVGLSNILRSTYLTSYKSGKEGAGDSWDELLSGLERDVA